MDGSEAAAVAAALASLGLLTSAPQALSVETIATRRVGSLLRRGRDGWPTAEGDEWQWS